MKKGESHASLGYILVRLKEYTTYSALSLGSTIKLEVRLM